jgi:hypothetical protein
MLNTNSDTLRRVVQADLNLQPRSSACWTAHLLSAFQGLRGRELYVVRGKVRLHHYVCLKGHLSGSLEKA